MNVYDDSMTFMHFVASHGISCPTLMPLAIHGCYAVVSECLASSRAKRSEFLRILYMQKSTWTCDMDPPEWTWMHQSR